MVSKGHVHALLAVLLTDIPVDKLVSTCWLPMPALLVSNWAAAAI